MKKIKTAVGYYAYEITAEEMIHYVRGSKGICDHCNTFAETGFLIPALNHFICPACFDKWSASGNYYEEDQEAEQRTCDYYESLFRNDHPCQICGVCHSAHLPHDPRTDNFIDYVKAKHGRDPIWADAVEHCEQEFRDNFDKILKDKGYKQGLEGAIEYDKRSN